MGKRANMTNGKCQPREDQVVKDYRKEQSCNWNRIAGEFVMVQMRHSWRRYDETIGLMDSWAATHTEQLGIDNTAQVIMCAVEVLVKQEQQQQRQSMLLLLKLMPMPRQ